MKESFVEGKYHEQNFGEVERLYLRKENGSGELRGRTGKKMQTYRMDLRTWGVGRVSWDEVKE